MKAVVQRVSRAEVRADGHSAAIGAGLVVLLCVERGDSEAEIDWGADKVARLRIFTDGQGKMNLSVADVGGGAMVISQFTLAGETARGNRPSFVTAAPPEVAAPMVERFAQRMVQEYGLRVARGVFGASMEVELVNDGPVTVIVERKAV